MSCGDDLLKSLKKAGCPCLEDIDGDVLDWHFENPELKKFFKEFCLRVDSGHLRHGEVTVKNKPKCETILLLETREGLNIENKVALLENNVAFKKECATLLGKKLQGLKNFGSRTDQYHELLESTASKNHLEVGSEKHILQPLKKHLGELLKKLSDSHDNLVSVLLGMSQSGEVQKAGNSSQSSRRSSHTGLLQSYLEEEKKFFNQVIDLAKFKEFPHQQNEENEIQILLEKWQNEQLRLHKCFYMTMKSYNIFRGLESALQLEISYLQRMLSKRSELQCNSELQEARKLNKRLESSLEDAVMKSNEVCDELSSKALASLLLTNYQIKLERLEHHKSNQLKILQWLRAEQKRLSFLKLSQKIESERNAQLLTFCQDVGTVLRNHHTVHQDLMDLLMVSKDGPVPEMISADDKVMETLGEVLGSDKDELIYTYDSIVKAATSMKSKVDSDRNANEKTLSTVSKELEELEIISELLYNIQEPLKDRGMLHGNLQLAGAMQNVKKTMKNFTSSVKDFRQKFQDFRKLLHECDRELFERKQKIKTILHKLSHQ